MLGLGSTLLLAWPLPSFLLYKDVIQHRIQGRKPYTTPGGIPCSVAGSRRTLSDAFTVRPLRPEDSFIPMGDPARLPSWVAVPISPDPNRLSDDTRLQAVDTSASGWPLRCFASESWQYVLPPAPEAGRNLYREVLRYNVLISQTQRGRVFLPLRPIYAGLFGDAATFGTTWWILLTLAAALRARRRCRRGLCARCAYDLNGSLSIDHCPECGTPIPGRAAGAHSATSRPVSL